MIRNIAFVMCATLFLAGCVSVTPGGEKAHPKQAAKYNVRLGVAYMQQGRLDVAMVKLQRALKQDPDLPSAYTATARLYERRGNNDLAKRYYRHALNIAPDDPAVQNAYGVFLCRHGHAAESEAHFLAAAHDPHYATSEAAYTNAGICLLKTKNAKEAEKLFRRALEVNPRYRAALWQLAHLSFEQGHYLNARAFLQRYTAHDKQTNPQVLWLAARTEHALGSNAKARAFVRKLVAQFPNSSEAGLAEKKSNNGR